MACTPANFVAGYHDIYFMPYGTSSGSALDLGNTGPEGVDFEHEEYSTPITGDALGPQTVIDHVNQGGTLTISFTIQEFKNATVRKFLAPWALNEVGGNWGNATSPYGHYYVGIPGEIGSQCAHGYLFFSPRAGTPAYAVESTDKIVMVKGMVVGPKRYSYDTRHRIIPVRFQCVPFYVTADTAWKLAHYTDSIAYADLPG